MVFEDQPCLNCSPKFEKKNGLAIFEKKKKMLAFGMQSPLLDTWPSWTRNYGPWAPYKMTFEAQPPVNNF